MVFPIAGFDSPESLVMYCELHSRSERALFSGVQINTMLELAGYPSGYPHSVHTAVWCTMHSDMEQLCELARIRMKSDPTTSAEVLPFPGQTDEQTPMQQLDLIPNVGLSDDKYAAIDQALDMLCGSVLAKAYVSLLEDLSKLPHVSLSAAVADVVQHYLIRKRILSMTVSAVEVLPCMYYTDTKGTDLYVLHVISGKAVCIKRGVGQTPDTVCVMEASEISNSGFQFDHAAIGWVDEVAL